MLVYKKASEACGEGGGGVGVMLKEKMKTAVLSLPH